MTDEAQTRLELAAAFRLAGQSAGEQPLDRGVGLVERLEQGIS